MNREIPRTLKRDHRRRTGILSGRQGIDPTRYTEKKELVIDSGKMLEHGKLIRIRPHTRFVHFPKHRHNYVEVILHVPGQTTHIIDGNQVVLQAGELLFLNQNAIQEIQPAGERDIAVNFIILPEFLIQLSGMMGKRKILWGTSLISCLRQEHQYGNYLHFQVSDILPIQNLVENMVWTLLNNQAK